MKFFKKFFLRRRLRRRLQAESSSRDGNPESENKEPVEDVREQLRNDDRTFEAASRDGNPLENEEPVEDVREQLRNDDRTFEAASHDGYPESENKEPVEDVREQLRNDNQTYEAATVSEESQLWYMTCSICLDDAQYAVKTNCDHVFCAACMVTCWNAGAWPNAVSCPLCRQQVTSLLRCFSEAEQQATTSERQGLVDSIDLYNQHYSGQPRSWNEYICNLPTTLYHRSCDFFMYGNAIWTYRLRILVCLAIAIMYFLSPVDIIPESTFGSLGLLDDVFVSLALAIYITVITRRFIRMRI